MGTDIFLIWDDITEVEKAVQSAASSECRLNAGHTGYLRAAIGMKRENALLRSIFPARYWYNTGNQALPYDFKTGLLALNGFAKIYLQSVELGTEPNLEGYALVAATDRMTKEMLEKKGCREVASTNDLTLNEAMEWLQELAEFFGLGAKKQIEDKNPRILIAW